MKEPSGDKPGIVEHQVDLDVLGGLDDLAHEVAGGEVRSTRAKLNAGIELLQLLKGVPQHIIIQGHHDHIDTLLGKLLGDGLANAGAGTSYQGYSTNPKR